MLIELSEEMLEELPCRKLGELSMTVLGAVVVVSWRVDVTGATVETRTIDETVAEEVDNGAIVDAAIVVEATSEEDSTGATVETTLVSTTGLAYEDTKVIVERGPGALEVL